ncbi:hypothetical protein [Chitinimonas sp.]|uniref:hypothetical protein n=1 Tax=Chitinimonas sp. TaxID=1934313 RepID=UPI0035B088A9
MSKKHSSEMDAAQARAALAALFGDAAPKIEPVVPAAEQNDVVAQKAAEADAVSMRVELLRRKRQAREEILKAAQASGLTLEELQRALSDRN